MEWLWWVGGGVLLCLIEVLTLDLVFLMLAGGALVAALPCALGAPVWVQVLTFGAVALLLLGAVRPWALRHMHKGDAPAMGVDAYPGRTAVVVVDVTGDGGRVKFAGEVWTARAENAEDHYPVGTDVQVRAIDGATAVVGPIRDAGPRPGGEGEGS